MKCQHCGKNFNKSRPHQIYCKLACKKADQKKKQSDELKSPYFVIPHIKRTPNYKSPVSDAEQMEINKAIDDKSKLVLETKVYRKNSREFKELKAMYEERDKLCR